MIKWPKSINVNGITYKVEYVPHRDGIDSDGTDCSLLGQVHYRKHTIRIWTGREDEIQEPMENFDTLLHELLHIIFYQNPAIEKLLADDDGNGEAMITCIARMLADTLVRNGIISLPKET